MASDSRTNCRCGLQSPAIRKLHVFQPSPRIAVYLLAAGNLAPPGCFELDQPAIFRQARWTVQSQASRPRRSRHAPRLAERNYLFEDAPTSVGYSVAVQEANHSACGSGASGEATSFLGGQSAGQSTGFIRSIPRASDSWTTPETTHSCRIGERNTGGKRGPPFLDGVCNHKLSLERRARSAWCRR